MLLLNIFYLDDDVRKVACWHFDKHLRKMIIETAQMLSTALRRTGQDAPYLEYQPNSTCNLWARENEANWYWLYELGLALGEEYEYRFGYQHHTHTIMCNQMPLPRNLPSGKRTPVPLRPKRMYEWGLSEVDSYRLYYVTTKAYLAHYTRRSYPDWWYTLRRKLWACR